MTRFWVLSVLGLIVLVSACDSENEPPLSSSTASGTPNATPTPSPVLTLSYMHPREGFSFEYPANWSLQEYETQPTVRIASFNLDTWITSQYPPGGILIDLFRLPISDSDPRPANAIDAMLGDLAGWRKDYRNTGEGGGDATWARSVTIAADDGSYRYGLIAFFEATDADESIVDMIAATFATGE